MTTSITLPRATVEQAIALICSARLCETNSMSSRREMLRLLIEATDILRAVLAQQAEPVQAPVAWIQPDHLQKARVAPFLCRVEPTQRCPDFVPLYTTPPQRPPLTEEEMKRVCVEAWSFDPYEIARAIERAHGIKEEK